MSSVLGKQWFLSFFFSKLHYLQLLGSFGGISFKYLTLHLISVICLFPFSFGHMPLKQTSRESSVKSASGWELLYTYMKYLCCLGILTVSFEWMCP